LILLLTSKKQSDPAAITELKSKLATIESNLEKVDGHIREEFTHNRQETNTYSCQMREELNKSIKDFGDSILQRMTEVASLQKIQLDTFSNQLTALTSSNEQKMDKMRETIEVRLKSLQDDNSQKLEQMRATVDDAWENHST